MSVIFEVPDVGGDMNGSLLSLHCPGIQFGIHPHQVLLLKGVSDLIEYEMTRLAEFYGIGVHEVDRPLQNESLSFQFDPISLNIDVLRLGIFGALPSAGAMCLQCRSIFVGIRPGCVQSSWDSLDLLLYLPDEGKYGSETDSISDGSSACHSANIGMQGISPELSGTQNSSVFLDTASVASRGLSESSFISKYYSVGGDSLSQVTGNEDEGRFKTSFVFFSLKGQLLTQSIIHIFPCRNSIRANGSRFMLF